ncbi:lysine exporter LysO family protein [Phocaeicola sp. HCN-40430]|uniref:lysine exporter LysO family protein n=1 Tax=Phocaeicola sp. HCN-40430 TaxID=3134664 RepID=UPI0030BF1756
MKGSLLVLLFFLVGCLLGIADMLPLDKLQGNLTLYILYALMLQVGISIGCSKNLKSIVSQLRPKFLLIPLATILGTLLFSALASLLLSQWSVFDCMAVGSGFAYYSLSSILITQFKEASLGLQLATELGTIALLSNIFREMMALLGTPLLCKYFGKLAPISAAGVNSMDVVLPMITRYSGSDMLPVAILHGLLIDMSVPFFVSFFCQL